MNNRKITKQLIQSFANKCGGTNIYYVQAPISTRLHCLAHIDGYRHKKYFQPIHNWSSIWKSCEGWMNESWKNKYSGPIKRGIIFSSSNLCHAYVEWNNALYEIHGVWG